MNIPNYASIIKQADHNEDWSAIEGVTACDQRDEIDKAFTQGTESFVVHSKFIPTGEVQPLEFTFFPNAGRGAACAGGDSSWTDCDSIGDLIDRYYHQERWTN